MRENCLWSLWQDTEMESRSSQMTHMVLLWLFLDLINEFWWVTSGWPYVDDRNAFSLYLLYIYSQHLSKLVILLLFMPLLLLLPPVLYFPEANLKLRSAFPIAASLQEPRRALCRISLEKVKLPWTAQLCSNCCCNNSKCWKSFVLFFRLCDWSQQV